jgi:hypothetical protein
MMRKFPQTILRQQLAWLRARYDHGAIPAGLYATIKTVETEIAWHDHAEHSNPCASTDLPQLPTAKENANGHQQK